MNMPSSSKSDLQAPRLGVGVMTWGSAKELAPLHPAKIAYGGSHGLEEEKRALKSSMAADMTLSVVYEERKGRSVNRPYSQTV
jgi:hypothetical protein